MLSTFEEEHKSLIVDPDPVQSVPNSDKLHLDKDAGDEDDLAKNLSAISKLTRVASQKPKEKSSLVELDKAE